MQTNQPTEGSDRRLGSLVKEIADSFKDVIQGEVRLAKAEARHTATYVGKHTLYAAIFAVIALAGILPILAFAIIGLGSLLGDNYWLSSLIVGVIMIAVGGGLAYVYAKKLKEEDLSLPASRDSLKDERNLMSQKIHDISRVARRRSPGGTQ